MSKQLILEVRYAEGATERHYPAMNGKERLEAQLARLRSFLLDAMSRGGAFSVELDRDECGASRRIFRVDRIATIDVFIVDDSTRKREAVVPDPRKSFFFLREIAEVNPVYQV